MRRSSPVLHSGAVEVRPSPAQVIAYRRSHPDAESFVVAANLSDAAAKHPLAGRVVLSTEHQKEGRVYGGVLEPWEALVLKPDS